MHSCKILIIDDDKDDVEILSDALMKNGVKDIHYVTSASNAIDYLRQIENAEDLPKLIVTDLYLPAKNGVEFIDEIKNTEPFSKIPVVLFSSLKYEMVKNIYNKISDEDYIKKPANYHGYLQVAQCLYQKIVA